MINTRREANYLRTLLYIQKHNRPLYNAIVKAHRSNAAVTAGNPFVAQPYRPGAYKVKGPNKR